MDSFASLVRLKEFEIEAHRRKVAQIQAMVADFGRRAEQLDREIQVEETRSGISDPAHYAYPTYAKAARQRRDNLMHSSAELMHQLDAAKRMLADMVEEFERAVPQGLRQPRAVAANGMDRARSGGGFDLNHAS